jgi:hypothetical protein
MSFAVKTSMLRGTSCRFSVTLRAVTTISSMPPDSGAFAAAAKTGGAWGRAVPASAAVTAIRTPDPAALRPRGPDTPFAWITGLFGLAPMYHPSQFINCQPGIGPRLDSSRR